MFEGFQADIGLEIHAQLASESKLFCSCSTLFGKGDNQNICPVCAGLPGALPVLNGRAVEFALLTGFALNCTVQDLSYFARKNYFYPDLPKGYQISQFDKPICGEGFLEFFAGENLKHVRILRAHLEEDAGKSQHFGNYSLINLNRSGVPLLEIVSYPDLHTPIEAAEYARAIRRILRYLKVCDGNLEEGSMRCDCNVSVRKIGQSNLGTKVEIKNLNSFRFIEKALTFEIDRQIENIRIGVPVVQETRLYDVDKNKTEAMRSKEDANDYRYFADPDLIPIRIESETIKSVQMRLPELPLPKARRLNNDLGVSFSDVELLTDDLAVAAYFENVYEVCKNPRSAAGWIIGELFRVLKENAVTIEESRVTAQDLGEIILMIDQGKLSGTLAKQVFSEVWKSKRRPLEIVSEKGLAQVSDIATLEKIVVAVIEQNSKEVKEYLSGKEKVFGFLVGQAMKQSRGSADPKLLNEILKKKLADKRE